MRGVPAGLPVRIVRGLAALLSVLVVAGSGYGWFAYRTLGSAVTTVSGVTDHTTATGAEQNILLIGDDHRPADATPAELAELSTGEDGGSTNTDTMMVLHIPAGGGAPTVVSLPRDSWVDIPGFGQGKLNSAFADGSANGGGDSGGMSLLVQTVQNLTGLTIDHFVRVSLLGFYDVAQVLGPVQVCLNAAVDDPYSGTDLPAGVSTLDAKQALSFVRQRHGLPRGDLDREVRQQYFLAAELRQVMSTGVLLNPTKLSDLLTAVGSAVQTDPGLNLLQLAAQAPQLADVSFTTIPVLGTPTITDAAGDPVSIVSIDTAALPAFFAELTGEPSAYTGATAAAPAGVGVDVVNGTGTAGLATSSAAALSALGFSAAADPTGGTSTTLTTVTYPAGMESQAKAVADAVPGAAVAESGSVTQVTLTLGTDGKTVVSTTPAGSSAAASSPAPSSSAPAAGGLTTSFSSSSCIN
jgi:LCP family protein required for cell wall assembly